jgi:hypothetical protein
VYTWPFSKFLRETGAFATTAPVESVMVPVTVAKAVWPKPTEAQKSKPATSKIGLIKIFLPKLQKYRGWLTSGRMPPNNLLNRLLHDGKRGLLHAPYSTRAIKMLNPLPSSGIPQTLHPED